MPGAILGDTNKNANTEVTSTYIIAAANTNIRMSRQWNTSSDMVSSNDYALPSLHNNAINIVKTPANTSRPSSLSSLPNPPPRATKSHHHLLGNELNTQHKAACFTTPPTPLPYSLHPLLSGPLYATHNAE